MSSPADQVMYLQRTIGNQAVQRLIKSGALQAKLKIGQLGDRYEQEADRVADGVMRMPEPQVRRQSIEEEEEEQIQTKPVIEQITSLVQRQVEEAEEEQIQTKPVIEQITSLVQRQVEEEEEEEQVQTKPVTEQITPLVQRQVEEEEEEQVQTKPVTEQITPLVQRQVEEEEEEKLHKKEASGSTPEVTPEFESHINATRGGGQPLPESTRAYFEPRFGRDFSQVRVHTDTRAAEAARAVNAQAFTVGKDVIFGARQYTQGASEGRRLMAHELTHVIQQNAVTPLLSKNTSVIYRQEEVSPTAEFIKEGWDEVNELGIVHQETGANLRDKPLPERDGSKVIERLSQNTKVFVLNHDKKHEWVAVTVVSNKGGGKFGYIYDKLIWSKLPEPEVEVYKIKSGDYPLSIAARERDYFKVFNKWGEDLRFVVNALVYVNTNAEHNGTGEPGIRKKDTDVTEKWFKSQATKDVYIWLPSSAFLKKIYKEVVEKGGGTGSITADIWESVKKGLKKLAYGVAFIGGLIHGFVESIVDALVGIVEMIIDLVVSIFTGSVLKDAKELWDAVSKFTWDDIKDAVGDWALKWSKKLESSSPWVAGHAHGYLTGYVIGEAAMLLISFGALAAAKGALWATRFGKAIKATRAYQSFAKGIEKARKAGGKAKKILDKAREGLKSKKRGLSSKTIVAIFRRGKKIKNIAAISLKRLRITLGRAGVSPKKYKLQKVSKAEIKKLKEAGVDVENIFGWISRDGTGKMITDFRGRPIINFTEKGLSSLEQAVITYGHEVKHIKDFAAGLKTSSEALAELAGEKLWLVVSKSLRK